MNLQTIKTEHPTGGTNALLTPLGILILWIASLFGGLGVDESVAGSIALVLVGIPTWISSFKNPKYDGVKEVEDNVPTHGYTGPG